MAVGLKDLDGLLEVWGRLPAELGRRAVQVYADPGELTLRRYDEMLHSGVVGLVERADPERLLGRVLEIIELATADLVYQRIQVGVAAEELACLVVHRRRPPEITHIGVDVHQVVGAGDVLEPMGSRREPRVDPADRGPLYAGLERAIGREPVGSVVPKLRPLAPRIEIGVVVDPEQVVLEASTEDLGELWRRRRGLLLGDRRVIAYQADVVLEGLGIEPHGIGRGLEVVDVWVRDPVPFDCGRQPGRNHTGMLGELGILRRGKRRGPGLSRLTAAVLVQDRLDVLLVALVDRDRDRGDALLGCEPS